jgi:hypothetical protein
MQSLPKTPAQLWNGMTFHQLRQWLASQGLTQAWCQATYDMVPEDIRTKWEEHWRQSA